MSVQTLQHTCNIIFEKNIPDIEIIYKLNISHFLGHSLLVFLLSSSVYSPSSSSPFLSFQFSPLFFFPLLQISLFSFPLTSAFSLPIITPIEHRLYWIFCVHDMNTKKPFIQTRIPRRKSYLHELYQFMSRSDESEENFVADLNTKRILSSAKNTSHQPFWIWFC